MGPLYIKENNLPLEATVDWRRIMMLIPQALKITFIFAVFMPRIFASCPNDYKRFCSTTQASSYCKNVCDGFAVHCNYEREEMNPLVRNALADDRKCSAGYAVWCRCQGCRTFQPRTSQPDCSTVNQPLRNLGPE